METQHPTPAPLKKLARILLPGQDEKESTAAFLVKCAAWITCIRLLLMVFVIVFPDSKLLDSFVAVQVTPIITGTLPGNDSYFYWVIATNGFVRDFGPVPWTLINFSPVYPLLLAGFNVVFRQNAPFVVNTICTCLTPFFVLKFARNVVKEETMARKAVILLVFNPVFLGYTIFALTEPLHYLLLFVVLSEHYEKGAVHRVIEHGVAVLLVLNRFIAVTLAAFYLYKALLGNARSLKERVITLLPTVTLAATYLAWELACKLVFGVTPSEMRGHPETWNHGFNFNPLDPAFVMQLPLLLTGVVLGVLVLFDRFTKKASLIERDEKHVHRVEMQAVAALGAISLLFLGLLNNQISLLRYLGTMFPLILIEVNEHRKFWIYPIVSFGFFWAIVLSHLVAFPVVAEGLPYSLTGAETNLVTGFTITFLVVSMALFVGRFWLRKKPWWLVIQQVALSLLIMPLLIYFP